MSSWYFVMEFFGWRNFKNRRGVAALAEAEIKESRLDDS